MGTFGPPVSRCDRRHLLVAFTAKESQWPTSSPSLASTAITHRRVVVCPVDYFYEGAASPSAPVEAIFHEDNLPDEWKEFTALNREESLKFPVINEHRNPLLGESCTPTEK